MAPRLVGLYSSAAQSGKSTVSSYLAREHGFAVVKFAGPLKDMTRGLLRSMGIPNQRVERMVEGDLKEEVIPGFTTVTARQIMQTLGTDWGREAVDNDLWVKVGIVKARSVLAEGDSVVIDDLRFPNELEAIRAAGGEVWRINRPDAPKVGASRYEGLLDDAVFDRTITNDHSIDHLLMCAAVCLIMGDE